jgi:predicted permease
VPLLDDVVLNIRPTLLALFGAVACLLVIACANVANMMLARSVTQTGEIAVRAALGASSFRLVRHVLSQSLILAVSGGAGGVLVAFWLMNVLIAYAPVNIPRLNETSLNVSVLTFALAISVLTSLLFGTVPALRVSKTDVTQSLKHIGRTATGSSADARFRGILVSAEVAFAMLLVIEAGLLINTFRNVQSVDLGMKTDHVMTMEIAPPLSKYPEPAARIAYFQRLLEKAAAVPGVHSAAVVSHFPLGGSSGGGFLIEGRTSSDPREWDAEFRSTSHAYFQTVGISLWQGRFFTPLDTAGAMPVAIINKAMAQRFFPGESALGKRIRRRTQVENPWLTVVGIVGDVKHSGPTREPYFEVYVPFTQPSWALSEASFPFPFPRELVVRTETDPMTIAPLLQQQVWAVDKDQPVTSIRTLEGVVDRSVSRQRFSMLLFGGFGLVGLILSSVGIYAVLAFSVTQRRHEIGVRSAMGASPQQVLALVMGQGMGFVVAGVVIGIAAALALTRLTSTLLFKVTPTDPATFVSVSTLLLAVALLACYIPARRAARVDPVVALRYE